MDESQSPPLTLPLTPPLSPPLSSTSDPIDVIGNMSSLSQAWLHVNEFTGPIPDNIGNLASLRQLNLNGNHLVGLIPQSLANMNLDSLNLNNNMLMGPIRPQQPLTMAAQAHLCHPLHSLTLPLKTQKNPSSFNPKHKPPTTLIISSKLRAAVVGGGPAGSSTVEALAAGGRETFLFERSPTTAKPCGGAIPLCMLEEFSVPTDLIDRKVTKIKIISPSNLINLNNNMLMGPILKFKAANATYDSNSFCQPDPGELCAPEVNALLNFLHDVNYPSNLASQWTGNDPCKGPWWGITCNPQGQVSVIYGQRWRREWWKEEGSEEGDR